MFDDSGFGGNSMFDSNHDGHLNAFERDNAECFLHDSDTYDQIDFNNNGRSGVRNFSGSSKNRRQLTPEEIAKANRDALKELVMTYLRWMLYIFIFMLVFYLVFGVTDI